MDVAQLVGIGGGAGGRIEISQQTMLQRDLDRRFLTAACMMVTIGPEQAHAVVACAGHPPPIFVPVSGEPLAVAADGDLLGMLPSIRLRTADVELLPGESLVAYTDGVTDRGAEPSRSPEQVLRERDPRAGAQELAGAVEALGHEVPGRHPDDMAILVIRFLGHRVRPPLAVASREQNRTPDV